MAKKKAKNAANQAALDRLYEVKDKSANTKYVHSVARAINSLAACPHAIESRKQAVELRYIGPNIAKVICPHDATATMQVSRGSSAGTNSSAEASSSVTSRKARPLPVVSSSSDGVDMKASSLSAKQVAYDKAVQASTSLKLTSGPWKVILIVDGREQRAEHVQAKLQMSGIPCEQRNLPIGDMAWMARSGDTEIMLGTIVERKEVNDLASSLFGTRYLEQRLRLQHCGLPQVLLLVEGDTSTVSNCRGDTLETCMMETRVQLNFQVITTRHLDDTVRFLKNVHRRILQRSFPSAFGDAVPTSLPSFTSPNANRPRRKKKKVSLVDIVFDAPPVPPLGRGRFVTYAELKAKVERDREAGTRTVGAIHAAMLKQIPTLSLRKVQAIQQAYPTPLALYETYVGLEPEDGKTLVQDFTTNTGAERNCRVGPKSAAEVYYTYTASISVVEGKEPGSSSAPVVDNNVARMPSQAVAAAATTPDDDSSFAAFGDFSASPVWSPESDSKLLAREPSSPPRKVTSVLQDSPTSPMDEMELALQRRRMQYQDSQKKVLAAGKIVPSEDDDFVDLTQGYESDAENNVGSWSSQRSLQAEEGGSPAWHASPTVAANTKSAAGLPCSSQGSSSVDDEEPLYVRVQRLHEARQATQSRKRRGETSRDKQASANKKPAIHATEVIEIE